MVLSSKPDGHRLKLHAAHSLYWRKRDRWPGHGLERTSMTKEAWAGGSYQYLELRGRFVVDQRGKQMVGDVPGRGRDMNLEGWGLMIPSILSCCRHAEALLI